MTRQEDDVVKRNCQVRVMRTEGQQDGGECRGCRVHCTINPKMSQSAPITTNYYSLLLIHPKPLNTKIGDNVFQKFLFFKTAQ